MLYFISSNKEKIENASRNLSGLAIEIEPKDLSIEEIQAEDIETVALDKAEKAFRLLNEPLITTDHGWVIHGLNGFPGPYMKFINDWFSPENFLELTKNLVDRRITLEEIVVYKDAEHTKLFHVDHVGILLKEIRGEGYPAMTITSFIDGMSNAEANNKGLHPWNNSALWKEFADWYKSEIISRSSPQPSL